SRFGTMLLLRLDQALGVVPELLIPEQFPEPLAAAREFESGIAERSILEAVIDRLLEAVLKRLRPLLGIQRLQVGLTFTDHAPLHFPVDLLRPTRSPRHLMELVRLYLERQTIPAEVASVAVQAARVAPLEFRQAQMFDSDSEDRWRHASTLLERLSGRLGETAVLRPHLQADAQPEFAYRYEP